MDSAFRVTVLSAQLSPDSCGIARLREQGWSVSVYPDATGVRRHLERHRQPCAGLLDLRGHSDPRALAELQPLLVLRQVSWVALVDAEQLDDPDIRHVIHGYCFDYVTMPCPDAVLESVLGHARGVALLGYEQPQTQPVDGFCGMIGESPAMLGLFSQLRKAARSEAPVFISGETGTGKELAANAIHAHSPRKDFPFVAINCGAIPAQLIQSELFGYERGAFTGANQRKLGRIELANKGTLFLDEIGDLPLDCQASLLRFLENGTVERLGGIESIPVDARIVSATHRDLEAAVAAGQFRADLYHRLLVIKLRQPPLRDRGDDILRIAKHALEANAPEHARGLKGFAACAIRRIHDYAWPGNVRELTNRVRQAVVMAEGKHITADDLGLEGDAGVLPGTLEQARAQAERNAILASLRRNRGRIGECARELGISRITLYRLMTRHGLKPEAEPANEEPSERVGRAQAERVVRSVGRQAHAELATPRPT